MPVWYLTFLVIIGNSLWPGVMCGWCTVVLRVGFLVSCTNLGLESLPLSRCWPTPLICCHSALRYAKTEIVSVISK
jgi:hypothetical protein